MRTLTAHAVVACLGASVVIGCGTGGPQGGPNEPSTADRAPNTSPPGRTDSAWEQLGDIVYLLPEKLPTGWTVKVATEREGRPQEEWQDHFEFLSGKDGILILGAHRLSPPTDPGWASPGPRVVREGDAGSAAMALSLVLPWRTDTDLPSASPSDAPEKEQRLREIRWRAGGFDLIVAQLATSPNDALIERIAGEFDHLESLDLRIPRAAEAAGFVRFGSAAGDLDVPDYTVSWAPAKFAGKDREAAITGADEGPLLWMNVGSRFYVQQTSALPIGPAEAQVTSRDRVLEMEFLLEGTLVSLGGRDVGEASLRALAESLRIYVREVWRAELGGRLAVEHVEA